MQVRCPRCSVVFESYTQDIVCPNCGLRGNLGQTNQQQYYQQPQQQYSQYQPQNYQQYQQQKYYQPKPRKKLMMIVSIIIATIIIVAGIGSYFLFVKKDGENSKNDGWIQIGISTPKATLDIKQLNDDFAVKIASINRKVDINETSWKIYDNNGQFVIGGEVYNIYDYGSMGNGREHSKGGYMKDDNGNYLTNPTDYWENYATHYQIVFANNDESAEPVAWKLSEGDQFFIRGPQNGGATQVGYTFKLIFDPEDEMIGQIPLS